jgi:ATP-dependent DNA ligase
MLPMLPSKYQQYLVHYPCYIQPKLNGVRALYQLGHFQFYPDINGYDSRLLSHLTEPLSKIFNASIILDGELYVHSWPLNRIEDALLDASDDTPLLEYHVFDAVNFHRPFESRFMAPASILVDTAHRHKTKVVETHRMNSASNVNYFYDKWLNAGYEGLIYRLNGFPYVNGRSQQLLKREKPRRRKPHGRGKAYSADPHP